MKDNYQKSMTNTVNRLNMLIILLVVSLSGFSQNVGINASGVAPNSNAGLDVNFTDKGMLIPRVALTSTSSFAPLSAHVAGMLVYNTATTGDVVPGFYYNTGSAWTTGFPAAPSTGSLLYWNGVSWAGVSGGSPGQTLMLSGGLTPYWGGTATMATLFTNSVSAITDVTATSGGIIINDGGSAIWLRGVCWNTAPLPTISNSKTTDGSGTGSFTSTLTGLSPGTTYYIRAYAVNGQSVSYGDQSSFTTTTPTIPILSATDAATGITSTTAVSGGNLSSNGNATITARGICYSTTNPPTIADTKVIDAGTTLGTFTSNLSGLTSNTLYYIRSYATNGAGTGYGPVVSFTTQAIISSTAITSITTTGSTSGGTLTVGGNASITERGVCWSTSANPTTADTKTSDGTTTGTFVSTITGLAYTTLYHVRAYATNGGGTVYGSDITFTTLTPVAPTLAATTAASAITGATATSGGNVTSNGGAPITERGLVWATTANPTTAAVGKVFVSNPDPGTGVFTGNLTGLIGGTTYYVRAYATNSIGTSYGTQVSFITTRTPPTLVTVAATNITGSTATSGGSMNWNGPGYSNYDEYGVCYSTSPSSASPIYVNTNTTNYSWTVPIAPWTTNITGLASNTTYYIRSFLYIYTGGSPSWSYIYGPETNFITGAPSAPVVASTTAITGISASSATTGGNITSNGGSALTASGVCWSTSPNPILATNNFTTDGTVGSFTSTITGLSGSTTYYVRAYATNTNGTTYAPTDVTFTTWVAPAYNVGDFAGGANEYGRVFYVSPDGTSLIAALGDQLGTAVWGCSGTNIGTSAALGTGAANTAAILAACPDRPIAASVASSCTDGGFNDWYLPSATELGLLVNSGILFPASPTPPALASYYCSSTDSASTTTISGYYYANNWQGAGLGKTTQFYVRPIRSLDAPTLPAVTTTAITNISGTTATGGGNVTNDGGAPILAAGVCWSTTSGPTIADSITNDATAIGAFNSSLTGLTFPTTYYVRAYVTTAAGTAYGSEVSFTTITVSLATVTTDAITNLHGTSATTGGNVTSDGGSAVFSRGVVWDINPNPDATLLGTVSYDVSNGLGTFVSNLTGLTTDQQYYVRAFAINAVGIAYGSDVVFTPTGNSIPTLTTVAVTSPTPTGGISGGDITSDGGDPIIVSGICWSDMNYPPTIADNKTTDGILTTGAFASSLSGLIAGNQYDIRAYATNSLGTAYGDEILYIPVGLPTLAIYPLTYNPLDTFAQLPISVSNTGGGTLSAYGVVWGTTAGPTIASHQGITVEDINNYWTTQNALISPLVANGTVTYYIRSYATSEAGTVYGTEIILTPGGISVPTVSTDGVYNKIGSIAEVGGTILSDGGDVITAGGLVWSDSANPDIDINFIGMTTTWTGLGGYSDYATGLTIGTTYHIRVYATNSAGTAYGADLSFVATAATIGQVISSPYGFGANVFSVDGTGLHGLMVYPYDYVAADWGCTSSTIGTTGTAVGTGFANSTAMVADNALNGCVSTSPYNTFAAEVAQWLGLDWYLPSKDELTLLKTNSVAAGVDMSTATYPIWSSSEVDATHAYSFDGTNWVSSLKTAQNMVWVIRSF